MKSTPRFTGETTLLSIGYKYNYTKILGFIANEGAGSTEQVDPYLSRLPDIYSNIFVRLVVCPHLIGRYFNARNAI